MAYYYQHYNYVFYKHIAILLVIIVIFTHLKLCVTVARHNFKWVKIQISLAGKGLMVFFATDAGSIPKFYKIPK